MRSLTDSLELFFTSWCLLSLLAMMGLPVFLFVCVVVMLTSGLTWHPKDGVLRGLINMWRWVSRLGCLDLTHEQVFGQAFSKPYWVRV